MSSEVPQPDLEALAALLAARDRQRKQGAPAPEDAAERIARSLLDLPPVDLDCAAVQEALPEHVAAELRGAAPTPEFARIQAHLRACPECSFVYTGMLQGEAEWSPEAPAGAAAPELAFDLSFLNADPFERLRTFVTNLASEIIAALQPAALPQLSYLVEPFFERARELPRGAQFRPAAAAFALRFGGQGRTAMPPAAVYLGATFLAMRELTRSLTPDRIASLQAEGRFEQEARRVALAAASDAGLRQPDAARFADEFIRRILAFQAELPASIDD